MPRRKRAPADHPRLFDDAAPSKRFSRDKGKLAKDRGMLTAAVNRKEILALGRVIAERIAQGHEARTVSADDVYRELESQGVNIKLLGNAAGSLFKGSQWEFTGRRLASARITNHARAIMLWKLK